MRQTTSNTLQPTLKLTKELNSVLSGKDYAHTLITHISWATKGCVKSSGTANMEFIIEKYS